MTRATAVRSADGATVVITNGLVAVTVNPERGADILSFVWLATGEEILWRNRRFAGLPPRRGDTDMDASSYFDNYPGGIQEIFPNAGAPTTVHGAPLPFHGEALRRPWTVSITEEAGGVEVVCATVLTRYPFRMTRTLRLGDTSSVLQFSSTVENLSLLELPVHWGLHPAFDTRTVAADGAVVYGSFDAVRAHPEGFGERQAHAPGTVVPADGAAGVDGIDGVGAFALSAGDGGTADLLYATVDIGWFGLRSPASELLATMSWPAEVFPELWIWQECRAPGGYPWFGTEHIVAVEPHTTSPFGPLAEEALTSEVLRIAGGESLTADFTLGAQIIGRDAVPVGIGSDGLAELVTAATAGALSAGGVAVGAASRRSDATDLS